MSDDDNISKMCDVMPSFHWEGHFPFFQEQAVQEKKEKAYKIVGITATTSL